MADKDKRVARIQAAHERFFKRTKRKFERVQALMENDPVFREKALAGETLTPKQKILCEEYARTGRIIQSAKLAGYKGTDYSLYFRAKEIIDRPDAKAYIEKIKKQHEEVKTVSREYIIDKLKELIESSKTKPSEKINAITTLAKLMGLMKETAAEGGKVVVFQTVGLEDQQAIVVPVEKPE